MIITISREFGSGGREIGKRLSEELNLEYYDKEIVEQLCKETGLSEKYIDYISQKKLYPYVIGKSFYKLNDIQSDQNNVLINQQKIILEIAKKDNCIIVGRGANAILKDYKTLDIFVYADMSTKIKRCQERMDASENLTIKELQKKIQQIDKNRYRYNELISNQKWGTKESYDLCINTTDMSPKDMIKPLANYAKKYFSGGKL